MKFAERGSRPPSASLPYLALLRILLFSLRFILLAPKDKDHYNPIMDLEKSLYTIVERVYASLFSFEILLNFAFFQNMFPKSVSRPYSVLYLQTCQSQYPAHLPLLPVVPRTPVRAILVLVHSHLVVHLHPHHPNLQSVT
jgi:hypothetical protein